jgi:hypothetical protein
LRGLRGLRGLIGGQGERRQGEDGDKEMEYKRIRGMRDKDGACSSFKQSDQCAAGPFTESGEYIIFWSEITKGEFMCRI